MERLFRLDEIEATTRRKVVTLRRDIREGRLKATRIGRQVRISETNLIDFLTRSGQPHTKTVKGLQ
jgi:excisionase family DNA binding protein